MWNFKQRSGFLWTATILTILGGTQSLAQESANTQMEAVFTAGPDMTAARMAHYIIPVANNDIEVIGGHGTGFTALNSAERWDSNNNIFTASTMNYFHDVGAMVQLHDKNWLIAGGAEDLGVAPGYAGAEIYNPVTGTFTATGSMQYKRQGCVAVSLDANRSLIVGGWYDTDNTKYPEVYNATTGTFSVTGELNTPRSYPLALPTTDNKAVVFWGMPPYGGTWYDSVELYDPSAGTFSNLSDTMLGESGWAPMFQTHLKRPISLQQMPNGNYLLWGYKDKNVTLITFDPDNKSFSKLATTPSLPSLEEGSPIDVLVDRKNNKAYVLYVKTVSDKDVLTVYVVDLQTNALVKATPSYNAPAGYYLGYSANIVLDDGRIFMTGGHSEGGYDTNFSPVNKTLFIKLKPKFMTIAPILYLLQ